MDSKASGSTGSQVVIDYTNWKGERRDRLIVPLALRWGTTEWHPDRQWLLDAHDVEKGQERTFAMKDIHSWRPAPLAAQFRR